MFLRLSLSNQFLQDICDVGQQALNKVPWTYYQDPPHWNWIVASWGFLHQISCCPQFSSAPSGSRFFKWILWFNSYTVTDENVISAQLYKSGQAIVSTRLALIYTGRNIQCIHTLSHKTNCLWRRGEIVQSIDYPPVSALTSCMHTVQFHSRTQHTSGKHEESTISNWAAVFDTVTVLRLLWRPPPVSPLYCHDVTFPFLQVSPRLPLKCRATVGSTDMASRHHYTGLQYFMIYVCLAVMLGCVRM